MGSPYINDANNINDAHNKVITHHEPSSTWCIVRINNDWGDPFDVASTISNDYDANRLLQNGNNDDHWISNRTDRELDVSECGHCDGNYTINDVDDSRAGSNQDALIIRENDNNTTLYSHLQYNDIMI